MTPLAGALTPAGLLGDVARVASWAGRHGVAAVVVAVLVAGLVVAANRRAARLEQRWRRLGHRVRSLAGSRPARDTGDAEHALYRHYDGGGELLYVGITNDLRRRTAQHAESKRWWRDVVSTRVAYYGSRDELEAAERAAIVRERPLHNIAHNGTRRARR